MRMALRYVLVLLLVGCAVSTTSTRSERKQKIERLELPIPADLQEHIKHAEQIGVELYFLDMAAAIGTDVLRERFGNPEKAGLGGYLPLQEDDDVGRAKDSFLVTFFTAEEPARIAYQIRVYVDSSRPTESQAFDPPKQATAELLLLIRARQAAIHAVPELVQPLNPVVLPAEAKGEDGILVYLLAGTTKPDIAVFGKHYRVLVAEDGTTVKYIRPLTKSILELPTRRPNGEKPEALWVTHLVTDWPLETHVFASLLYKLPIYVTTGRGTWWVDDGKIAFLGNQSPTDVQKRM